MSNEIIKVESNLDFSNKELQNTIKNTIAKNLSNEEFEIFIQYCKGTKLNPFKREIWAIKAGALQIMTGINGFFTIANAHPMFDGIETDFLFDDKKNVVAAICRVYRKDRKYPSTSTAFMNEYQKTTPIWKEKPRHMLLKVAKSIALREAFPQELNGLYSEEEMPANFAKPKDKIDKQAANVIDADEAAYQFCKTLPHTTPIRENTEPSFILPEYVGDYVLKGKRKLSKSGLTLQHILDTDEAWLFDLMQSETKKSQLTDHDLYAVTEFIIYVEDELNRVFDKYKIKDESKKELSESKIESITPAVTGEQQTLI